MSEENIEAVCRALDEYRRGDVEGFLVYMDPDVEVVRRAWSAFNSTWTSITTEALRA